MFPSMWTCSLLKTNARRVLSRRYGACLACVCAALLVSGPAARVSVFLAASWALFWCSGTLRREDLHWARGLLRTRRR